MRFSGEAEDQDFPVVTQPLELLLQPFNRQIKELSWHFEIVSFNFSESNLVFSSK